MIEADGAANRLGIEPEMPKIPKHIPDLDTAGARGALAHRAVAYPGSLARINRSLARSGNTVLRRAGRIAIRDGGTGRQRRAAERGAPRKRHRQIRHARRRISLRLARAVTLRFARQSDYLP
ncbi:MAG: hypothetical protein IT294_12075 [Deltaproteobacteria bacterium]|nr:hypothetical protein [Deltaproteobacteria bacterium]